VYFVCVGNLWKITFAQGTPKSTHEQNRNADQAIEIIGSGGEAGVSMSASVDLSIALRAVREKPPRVERRPDRPRQKKTPELSLRGLSFNRSGEDQK
jgi:hypothetical protein